MTDKLTLLRELRIERSSAAPPKRRLPWPWIGCGIALIAVGTGTFHFASRAVGVPVRVAIASTAATGENAVSTSLLDASGYVVARREATVSSKVTGKVVEVLLEEGQRVEKDQVIARLDESNARAGLQYAEAQLQQADSSLKAAKVAYDDAKTLHDRNAQLLPKGWISQIDFDKSKASYHAAESALELAARAVEVARASRIVAERAVDDTVVRAPFSGIVTVKAAQPGEMVSPVSAGGGFTRTGIGTIVDMDSIEVEVDVSENYIGAVHAGQSTRITLNAYPDNPLPGEVIAVIPTADRAKATVKVRIRFVQLDPRVLPQMGVRVSFLSEEKGAEGGGVRVPQSVIVPAAAILSDGATGVAFVIHDDIVERRTVQLGRRQEANQVVVSGLAAGDRLAIGDFSQLDDQTKVRLQSNLP